MNRFINWVDDHWEGAAAVGCLLAILNLILKG